MFQSTPPRGGRRAYLVKDFSDGSFNPRPRAGGDGNEPDADALAKVSIHAPARGATPAPGLSIRSFMFQSTPPRGGRLRIQKVAEY